MFPNFPVATNLPFPTGSMSLIPSFRLSTFWVSLCSFTESYSYGEILDYLLFVFTTQLQYKLFPATSPTLNRELCSAPLEQILNFKFSFHDLLQQYINYFNHCNSVINQKFFLSSSSLSVQCLTIIHSFINISISNATMVLYLSLTSLKKSSII